MSSSSNRAATRAGRTASTQRLLGAAIAAALGFAGTARADLYWDADGATPGGGPTTTAAGTWGVSNFWSTSAAGDVATGAWTPGETAVFSAGTNVTGAYIVTVDGTQDAAGIRVEEGALTFSGGALTLSGAAPSLIFNSVGMPAINTALSAANQVTFARIGTGTPNINLNAANAFGGGVLISDRVRINANVAGALGSGTVTVQGTESSISNDMAGTSLTYTNNFVLNPLDLAGFSAGFAAAGSNFTTATFAGNISGNADVIISPTPNSTNTNTNGNGMTIFTGTNTYTGKTIINMAGAGTFRLGSATALPVGTALEVGRTITAQNVGLVDLFGQDISISSLATRTPVLTGAGIGITNSKSGAADQSTITITGGDTTTFAAIIGARTSTSLTNVGGAGTNAGTTNISLTLASSHTGKLTLSGQNSYTGDTVVDGGTLVAGRSNLTQNSIAGNVIVNSGGTFGSTATNRTNEYGVGGSVTVNSGATLAPGISDSGLVGVSTLRAGSLTANGGSKVDVTLFSATNFDTIRLSGPLTLGSGGTKTIDVTLVGDAFVATPSNPLELMTYSSLIADPGDAFTLGNHPGLTNPDFVYALTTEATRVILTAMPTTTTLVWDADAAGGTLADGAGTWRDGGAAPHFFTDIVTGAETPWGNANNFNAIIGASATGVGGVIALDGNVRAGGKLTFANVATAYTIGDVGETDTLTVAGGITNNAIGTTINAPLVLEASQTVNITDGSGSNTLTLNGAVSESTAGSVLTKVGGGTLILNAPVNVGGLAINAGTVQMAVDGALGSTPVSIDNGTLRANVPVNVANPIEIGAGGGTLNVQAAADSVYSGNITGTGVLNKQGSGKLTLTGTNTFNGLSIRGLGAGVAVGSDAALGIGPITINGDNTLSATGSFATDNGIVTAPTAGNKSNINTAGFAVTFNGVVSGPGDLVHRGGGRIVLAGANVQSGNYEFAEAGGTLETTSLSALGTGNLVATVSGTLETTADLNMRDIMGTADVTKTGTANATIRRARDINTLAINAGRVTVAPHGGGTGTSKVKALSIAPGAALHLSDNDLIVDYADGGPSPEAQIRQYVRDGRAAGSTSGIFSTPGSVTDDVVLAVADNAEWGKTSLNSVAIDLSSVVGKYTYFGDANMDGAVTGDDYLAIDAGLGIGTKWLQGDFNMSGDVTGDDYLAIDANLGKGTPTPLAFAEMKAEMVAQHVAMFGEEYLVKLAEVEANGFEVVPEPGALSLIGLGAIGLLGRRRRRAL